MTAASNAILAIRILPLISVPAKDDILGHQSEFPNAVNDRGLNMERRVPVAPGMQAAADPAFSFAFLPIVDTAARKVFSYEALIRGPGNEPAATVFKQVPWGNRHRFDQDGRAVAIALAVRLGIECHLNLNFLPRSLHSLPGSILHTLEAADRCALARQRIILRSPKAR